MVTTYIFDFDGLLVDSEPIWERASIRLLHRHGIPPDVGNRWRN